MKIIPSILITLGTCLSACSVPDSPHPQGVPEITLDLDQTVQEKLFYSSFVDSIAYIPLETTEESLLGEIRDILITDSLIFVLPEERTSIYLFDHAGNFLRKIKKAGMGPGEYSVINQFSYNKKRKSLAIASHKIIEYDLFGNLKNEFTTPYHVSDLHLFDNGDFLLSRLDRIDKPDDIIIHTDNNGNIKRSLLKRNPHYRVNDTHYWEFITFDDQIRFISPQVENTLYTFGGDSLVPLLSFHILPEVPKDFWDKEPFLFEDHYCRTVYRENKNWIHLVFYSQSKFVRRILYQKKTHKYWIAKHVLNDMDDSILEKFFSSAENNTFVNSVKPPCDEDNPVLQILYLKE